MNTEIIKYKEALRKASQKIIELDGKLKQATQHPDVAIIGYDCRFPAGANNPALFWESLKNGFDAVTEIESDRFDVSQYYNSEKGVMGKSCTRYASLLDKNVRRFDNRHFEISGVEATSIDPQQRMLLEVSWDAMENAGLDIHALRGSNTGVFIGVDSTEYFKSEVYSGEIKDITPYSIMGVSSHAAAGRISYYYDFKGPAIVCNTACSSSLVALRAALDSLENGQCDMALVGGVNLLLAPNSFVGLSQFQALSVDGKCKTFDSSADGFGRGEGCGIVLLKRRADAEKNGDVIEAVIKSAYIGHDGKSNGFYAPSGLAEQRVMDAALKSSGVCVDDVDYIEAHGTGTPLGDSIETSAIAQVYRKKKSPMYIGSVKSNIGHLEAAAGMAGLIKILLSLKHKQLPPSIHYKTPNPNINFDKLSVVTDLMPWEKGTGKRIAGLNAFGISGTLAHVLVEEYQPVQQETQKAEIPWHVLTLSAQNQDALKRMAKDFEAYIRQEDISIADVTYSSNLMRSHSPFRFALAGDSKENFLQQLSKAGADEHVFAYHSGKAAPDKKRKICFLFTGQGSIYKNIAKELYILSSVFAAAMNQCNKCFQSLLGISVIDTVYGKVESDLSSPKYSQPVIFSVEYSLSKLWETTGIKADTVIGHSIGEFAAACYAGLMNFEDAAKMIASRVELLGDSAPAGKMVGILADKSSVLAAIVDSGCSTVEIAAVNAPNNVTISGKGEEVDQVISVLRKQVRAFANDLNIPHPFHNKLLKPYEQPYLKKLREISFHEPSVNLISSITGKRDDSIKMGTADYWAAHMTRPVQFMKAVEAAREDGCEVFLELGGTATLSGLCEGILKEEECAFIPTLREGTKPYQQFSLALRDLYLQGVPIFWADTYANYHKNIAPLPGYPFCGKNFWKDIKDINSVTVADRDEEKRGERMKTSETLAQDQLQKIVEDLKRAIQMITGTDISDFGDDVEILALGFDSLMFMALSKQIEKKYNVDIPLNIFFVSLKKISDVAAYILEHSDVLSQEEMHETLEGSVLDEEEIQLRTVSPLQVPTAVKETDRQSMQMFTDLFERQFALMQSQNNLLSDYTKARITAPAFSISEKKCGATESDSKSADARKPIAKLQKQDYYVPYKKLDLSEEHRLDELQQTYLKKIEERYTSLFRGSKERSQQYRRINANARNTAGFRMDYKEMLYQLVADSAWGSTFRDVDGNEMIDITMGFGVNLFGHSPQFVRDALKDEIENGMPLGPMGRLTGEVASRISALTGMERVFFCNSGTEADMFAMRMARAVTGKNKIVCFTGSYHGTSDGVLGLPNYEDDGTISSFPQVPGITENAVKDLILLTYDSKDSLEYIKAHAEEIAGVLVESVQSRRPDQQPVEFLRELRKITEDKNIALIFDEVITGFRIAPGGAQEYFGIQADMATYGKVIGGGMPIGIVSGNAKYLDSVDGGMWNYGDNSTPQVNENRTLAVGTFCHHPMAMASANAVLQHIEAHKQEIYPALNALTDRFAQQANQIFEEANASFRVVHFGSLFRFIGVSKEQEVFYYGLLEKGVYIWEGRNCFLSTAHSESDVAAILRAIADTIKEMEEAGFFGFPLDSTIKKNQSRAPFTAQLPLSLIQERLYSQILLSEADPFDLIASYYVDELDTKQLENHVNTIIGRHESLRTALVLQNGVYHQQVLQDWDFHIREIVQENETDVNALVASSISKFDLAKAPLVEIVLIRLGYTDKNLLVFHFHHTTSDGMSMNLFVQELLALYGDAPLKDCKQYRDYVAWEQEYLHSDQLMQDKVYWAQQLEDIPLKVELPYDKICCQTEAYMGKSIVSYIEAQQLKKLKHIAVENSSSLFTLLLSAVNILLHRFSGKEELAVVTPVSNRYTNGFETSIGMFTNTVALASRMPASTKFTEYLQQVRDEFLSSFAHHNYPYNMLVNDLGASGSDPFNIMFVYENTNARNLEDSELRMQKYEYMPVKQEFDLTFEFLEENEKAGVFLRYRSDLFNEATIQLLNKRLYMILDQIVQEPHTVVGEMNIVSAQENDNICNTFNRPWCQYPRQETLVTLFEEQVAQTPQAIAIVFEEEAVTYAQLNSRANALAHRLLDAGVNRNDTVALLTERSVEMAIAILGTLKAGATYVPIDPQYPVDRIAYIIKDCAPKAILSYQYDPVQRPDFLDLLIDLEQIVSTETCIENPEPISLPHDVAYIIYTSGTTGNPKGVMVEHRNVVRLLFNDEMLFDFGSQDVWMMFHSYCFDFSVWEFYGALLHGGKLTLPTLETIKDSKQLLETIQKNQVTILNQVPTSFYNLAQADTSVAMTSVRYLIFGGEALSPTRLRKWHADYPAAKIVNMYGITETTVHVTYREIGDAEIQRGISDIGRAIPTLSVYVMRGEELCGIGMQGELCVAGDGVARGYKNLEELTNQRFVKNPFGPGLLYRSGDLARWLPEGNLEYLGRMDQQIKIRGYRIELGEIENAIRKIPGIQDATVIAREDAGGENAIHAYVVSDQKQDLQKIKRLLENALPSYMVPAYMLQLDQIPITRNGKLDRRALPEIQAANQKEYVAPVNQTEETLCEIFAAILGLSCVGTEDNFFELGGHSLRATRLMNQVEAQWQIKLPMRSVFQYPTVSSLSAYIRATVTAPKQEIKLAEQKLYYPMSSAQRRMYLLWQLNPCETSYNMSSAYTLTGDVSVEKIQDVLLEITRRHEILRTSFLVQDGALVQKIREKVKIDFEYLEDSNTDEHTLRQTFVRPFDLENGPLLRAILVKRISGYLLLFDIHHIVSDGMSVNIILKEFTDLYNGLALELPTRQYKDYSQWMLTQDLSKQMAYWVNQFADDVPTLEIPTDFPRPLMQNFSGASVSCMLGGELSDRIRTLAQKYESTEYMFFLVCIMVLLSKYSRQEDIVVGSPVSGRNHQDLDTMLGMFVNTLALRGAPKRDKSIGIFLQEMRKTCLDAFENQNYPFEDLIEAVGVQRDLSRNPLFDVMFAFQNQGEQSFDLAGTTILALPEESPVAKFDLTFNISPESEGFHVQLEYCTALYEHTGMQSMLDHFVAVLEQAVENENIRIADIQAITQQEKQQILQQFNKMNNYHLDDTTIVKRFEAQVKKTPDHPAILFDQKILTYKELSTKANAVANKLIKLDVRPGDCVVIQAHRNIDVLVGIYGILKTGAAYVPLAPEYPKERVRHVLKQCMPSAIIGPTQWSDGDIPVLSLENLTTVNGQAKSPYRGGRQKDLAQIIYTSGSTGMPKGVKINNRNILSLVVDPDYVELSEDSRILQAGALSFDASTFEIFGATLCGGTLVMPPQEILSETTKLKEYIKMHSINILFMTTALFNQHLENDASVFDGIEYLFTGGEKAAEKYIALQRDRKTVKHFANIYGPTETTTFATSYPITQKNEKTPIGKPLANKNVYIMDQEYLCGIGIQGELCIAGEGVADGYMNDMRLTHKKFVPNPFGEGMMYRTGDLARWQSDGNIEFLGRMDDQVKIRGFRIELSDIEHVLRSNVEIQNAAAIVRKDATGDNAIHAYLVSENPINIIKLKEELRNKLPDYMVPAYICQLEALPVNKNGKVDKNALPKIKAVSSTKYLPPSTKEEEALCQVFQEILGIEKIGVDDSFIENGGDSIKAIRVVSKLREYNFDIAFKDIMLGKTVKRIAKKLIAHNTLDADRQRVIGSVESTPILRDFFALKLENPDHFNQAVILQLEIYEQELAPAAFSALAKHHDMLRSVCRDGQLEILDETENCGFDHFVFDYTAQTNAAELIEKKCDEIQADIDLAQGPLCKLASFYTDTGSFLMICIHHLIVDGVSWRILLEDLETALTQLRQGEAASLPNKTTSFKAWAHGLSAYRNSAQMKKERTYWEKTQSCAKLLKIQSNSGSRDTKAGPVQITFTKDETCKLLTDANRTYHTQTQSLLLSALTMSVRMQSEQRSVTVGMETHGRADINGLRVDRTVGWFTGVYPVNFECQIDLQDSIVAAKETLNAVPNDGFGFAVLNNSNSIKNCNIYFNYLGEMDEGAGNRYAFGLTAGVECAPENKAMFQGMSINAIVLQGQMQISFTWEGVGYTTQNLEMLAERYAANLRRIIDFCVNSDHSIITKSDVASTDVDDNEFFEILDMFSQEVS